MGKVAERVCAVEPSGSPKTRRTVFTAIFESDLPDGEKRADRISHEGLEILLAGGYTTVKAMSLVTFFVLDDPTIKAALQKELGEAMPDPFGQPDLGVLQALPLLVCFRHPLYLCATRLVN